MARPSPVQASAPTLTPAQRFPAAAPYLEALAEGRLLIKHCSACGSAHFYPREHCPFCGHAPTEWLTTRGVGTLYSFSIVHGAKRPTAVAVVELPEGPRITTSVIDADVFGLRIGDPVELHVSDGAEGVPAATFTTPQANRARAYVAQALHAAANGLSATDDDATPLRQAAVVGAGSMGSGITTALLAAGLPVSLIDRSEAVLDSARQAVHSHFDAMVKRGRLSADEAAARRAALRLSTRVEDVADADLVIEAVWEQLALKQEIFAQIDRHAPPHAILGSNTSALDIDRIADATSRPGQVVGLHFFSPAHVMPLLEVVRGPRTRPEVVASAQRLGARLRKTAVVVGVCHGFVGNRLLIARDQEADRLLLEGALPQQIDRVLTEFGLPMGSYELADMAGGIELVQRVRQERGQHDPILAGLVAAGRLGQKTGKGFYRYEPGKRRPIPDPEVTALIEQASRELGIERRAIGDDEVRDRLLLPMINEGAKLVEEGIVDRASDIDVVWQRGFGWPAWRGGPMYHADRLGAAWVLRRLGELQERFGERFRPAALLERLAREGGRFVPGAD